MVITVLLAVFCLAMVWGGAIMIRRPAAFVGDCNPTLQLLSEYLPDWVVHRLVQVLGGLLIVMFLSFFVIEYVA